MTTDTRTRARTVLVVGASGTASPTDVLDSLVRPTVARFGGRVEGAYEDRIVASFPDGASAVTAASDLEASAAWAVPGVTLDTALVADRSETLPSASAVTTGARAIKLAGAAIPLGGAGVGAIVLWQPSEAPSVIQPAPPVTEPAPEPAAETADHDDHGHDHDHEPSPFADAASEPVLEPDLDVDGVLIFVDDDSHLDVAIDALTRFDEAGLDVPEGLQIFFHDKDAPECSGHTNRAFATHGGENPRIDMCTPHDFTLRHEIAHSWAHDHLDDGTVEEFLGVRGLQEWRGNPEWAQNGSEHAAHIIAWGLGDRPRSMSEIPDAHDMDDLGDAFELLTGTRPLHDRSVVRTPAEDSFTAMDLVDDTPPAPAPEPIQPAETPAQVTAVAAATEPYEAPSTGAALAPEDPDAVDLLDDDDDDDEEPATL